MKPDRFLTLHHHDLGVDPNGTYVLVTNLICTLPHNSVEAYQASHADGCLATPYEGYVFVTNGDTVVTWQMEIITGWHLVKVSDELRDSFVEQMRRIVDAIEKEEKKARRKRGKKS